MFSPQKRNSNNKCSHHRKEIVIWWYCGGLSLCYSGNNFAVYEYIKSTFAQYYMSVISQQS